MFVIEVVEQYGRRARVILALIFLSSSVGIVHRSRAIYVACADFVLGRGRHLFACDSPCKLICLL